MAKKRGNPNMKKGAPSVNPKGRKKRLDSQKGIQRADGWYSAVTGLGTTAKDKRVAVDFCADIVDYSTAVELLRGDDVAHRAVMIPIEDGLRNGFDFNAKLQDESDVGTKELQEDIEDDWELLGVKEALTQALLFERGYGGAAVLLGVRDGVTDLSRPLKIERVQSLDFLTVFEPRECIPSYYYADPRKAKYGKPSHYRIAPYSNGTSGKGETHTEEIHVHESRLLIFPGIKVTRDLLSQLDGWGDSILSMLWRVLRDFNIAWGSTGVIVSDFAQGVHKVAGLNELLAEDNAEVTTFKKMIQAMELSRSVLNTIVIDAEDEYGRETTAVTGLGDLLQAFMARVSSAAGGIPITKLFGTSPGGLNATGESDINQWDDRVKSYQDDKIVPHLRRICEILLHVRKVSVEKWSIDPRPLRQQTDKEKAETRKLVADTDKIYLEYGVVGADEIRSSRFEGDAYSLETVVDSSVDAATLEEAEAAKQAEAEMQAEAMKREAAGGNDGTEAKPVSGDTDKDGTK